MTSGMDTGKNNGHMPGKPAFARWTDILRQIKELYVQLEKAEHARRDAVRFGGVEAIETATERQKRLLDRFDELDAARRKAMVEWQQARGLSPNPRATLSDCLAALEDEAERSAVREMKRQLDDAARRLRTAAEANRDLVQAALDAVTARLAPGGTVRNDYIYGNAEGERPMSRPPSGYDIRT